MPLLNLTALTLMLPRLLRGGLPGVDHHRGAETDLLPGLAGGLPPRPRDTGQVPRGIAPLRLVAESLLLEGVPLALPQGDVPQALLPAGVAHLALSGGVAPHLPAGNASEDATPLRVLIAVMQGVLPQDRDDLAPRQNPVLLAGLAVPLDVGHLALTALLSAHRLLVLLDADEPPQRKFGMSGG